MSLDPTTDTARIVEIRDSAEIRSGSVYSVRELREFGVELEVIVPGISIGQVRTVVNYLEEPNPETERSAEEEEQRIRKTFNTLKLSHTEYVQEALDKLAELKEIAEHENPHDFLHLSVNFLESVFAEHADALPSTARLEYLVHEGEPTRRELVEVQRRFYGDIRVLEDRWNNLLTSSSDSNAIHAMSFMDASFVEFQLEKAIQFIQQGYSAEWSIYHVVKNFAQSNDLPENGIVISCELESRDWDYKKNLANYQQLLAARDVIIKNMVEGRKIHTEPTILMGSVLEISHVRDSVGIGSVEGIFAQGIGTENHLSAILRQVGRSVVKINADGLAFFAGFEDRVAFDMYEQKVYFAPAEDVVDKLLEERKNRLFCIKNKLNAMTACDVPVDIALNVSVVDTAVEENIYNAEADVGLFRSEVSFLLYDGAGTTGAVQQKVYKNLIRRTGEKGRKAVLRVFDYTSSDKRDLRSKNVPLNANELYIAHNYVTDKELSTQLGAMLVAISETGREGYIMFPLVSSASEMQRHVDFTFYAGQEHGHPVDTGRVRFCAQIESVEGIDALYDICDKTSITPALIAFGTNDLGENVAQMLHPDAEEDYSRARTSVDHFEPELIRQLQKGVESIERFHAQPGVLHTIEYEVCGNMAARPEMIPLLLGLGFRKLSVDPSDALKVSDTIGKLSIGDCESLVRSIVERETSDEVRVLVNSFCEQRGIKINT